VRYHFSSGCSTSSAKWAHSAARSRYSRESLRWRQPQDCSFAAIASFRAAGSLARTLGCPTYANISSTCPSRCTLRGCIASLSQGRRQESHRANRTACYRSCFAVCFARRKADSAHTKGIPAAPSAGGAPRTRRHSRAIWRKSRNATITGTSPPPRRSRTAKASHISRHAAKSRCAREWGGWGRLSDDGPGHYNPDPSAGPWVGGVFHRMAVQ
jgi:hypothetical protein